MTTRLLLLMLATLLWTGCITQPQHPSATQPATVMDLATTQPSYWFDKPGVITAQSPDFQKLFAVCEDVSRDFLFEIDRVDYRRGVLTTVPMVSAQWFEIWRRDNRSVYDVAESTIAPIRRSIRFEFERQPDDTWTVTPKVLVERESISEKRITAVVRFRSVFAEVLSLRRRPTGTREADEGILLPERYWYPVRRDADFERAVGSAVRKKLRAVG